MAPTNSIRRRAASSRARAGTISFVAGLLLVLLAAAVTPAQTISKDQYISGMDASLNEIIRRSDASRQLPLVFSAMLFYAHEAIIADVPLELLQAYVDGLREAGAHRIDFNPGTWPWRVGSNDPVLAAINREKYDKLVDYIRASGLLLNLNPMYSTAYNRFSTFAEWKAAAIPVWVEIASRYKPDTFVVAHEPTTMNDRLKLNAGPLEWRSFVEDAARAIKDVSPSTRLGAGFLHYEMDFFEAILTIPEIEAIGLDIYTFGGYNVIDDNFTHLAAYEQMVERAQKAGKSVFVEETWRPAYVGTANGLTLDESTAVGIGDRTFQPVDDKWLRAMTQTAAVWGLEAVTPSWTQPLFHYAGPNESNGALDEEYNRQVAEAIAAHRRTATFETIRGLTQRLAVKHRTVHSGSFRVGPLAGGSIVSMFPFGGLRLADSSGDATAIPLPVKLAGTEIVITDQNGLQKASPLINVRPGQINFVIPDGLAEGPATIDVRLDSGASLAGSVGIARTSPGIYAANQNGMGVAAAYIVRSSAPGIAEFVFQSDLGNPPKYVPVPLDLGPPAEQVQLVLFGTGIRGGSSFRVRIGGEDVPITYAGDQRQFVGLDQVQVVLPRSLAGRGEVPIRLEVDDKLANTVTIHIR